LKYFRENEIKEINKKIEKTKKKPSQTHRQRELKLHELRAETYNGLVRLIKPGCRTIILLIDNSTALLLARQFYHTVWPYRKLALHIYYHYSCCNYLMQILKFGV